VTSDIKSAYIQSLHCAGLLDVQNILSADTGTSRQTVGHSFGDHLSSESVSVAPSSGIEASIVLYSVFMTRVSQCPISLPFEHPVYHRLSMHCALHGS
jgi:hypothetical protein